MKRIIEQSPSEIRSNTPQNIGSVALSLPETEANIETTSQQIGKKLYDFIEDTISPEGIYAKLSKIDEQLAGDESLRRQAVYDTIYQNLVKESNLAPQEEKYKIEDRILQSLKDAIEEDPETNRRYNNLVYERELLLSESVILSRESSEYETVIAALSEAAKKSQEGKVKTEAPLKDYKSNTKESWKYVSDQEVTDYLSGSLFVDTHKVLENEPNLDKTLILDSGKKDKDKVDFPVSLFVYAAGFDSWTGRGGVGSDKSYGSSELSVYRGRSIDAIKHYASLPTDFPVH